MKCATDDDEINLSSLIKSTSNYIVKVNKTEFHINVCRPLVPNPGLTCVHGSAVCKTSLGPYNEYVNEVVSYESQFVLAVKLMLELNIINTICYIKAI